ncbi:hypothetical protein KUTeg_010834 [Tegillarca granosa]|uniref:Adenomatous polyposis coli protein n=1 Tax=Tegillarca granosa TaxID=220873 RepID=A0ABQ9F261_TEGGR|nr:hypothetical protein KUTeg_010834 [Tegillarca granosa]
MYERNKMTKPTKGMIRSGSAPVDIQSDSVKTFASEEIPKFVNRSETVRHQQKPPISEKPKSQPQNTSQIMGRGYHYDNNQVINQRVAEKARHLSKLHIMIRDDLEGGDSYGDTVKSYATEDTPMTQSAAASPGISKNHMEHMDSSKCMEYVSKIDVQVNDDCIKSYAIEGTPYNGSIPTSPKHDKNQNLNYKFKYVGGNMPPVEVEDTIQAYATEDTPLNFSRATSLSDLSIKTSDEPAENKLPQNLNSVSEPEPIPDESLDQHSDNSSLLDESDELLSELIQSAMPKGKVSRRLDMDRAAEGSETTDTFKFANPPFQKNNNFEFKPQRTSSHITAHNPVSQIEMPKVYAVEGTPLNFSNATSLSDLTIDSHDAPQANKMNKPRETISSTDQSSTSHAATFGTSTDDSVFIHVESSDSLRTYMVEGTPQTFSRNDSLSSISIMDDDSKDLEKLKKLCETSQSSKAQSSNKVSQSHWSTHGDEILQREVEGQSSDETKSSSVKGTEEKLLKPSDYSHGSSLSSIPSQEHQELLEQEGIAKKDKISSQNGGLSHKDSLSSLSSDSGDDDPETDEALLDECISSALPKSRSENKSRLSQSSTSISKDIMSSSFSGRGGSTHSLTYRDSKVTETSRTYEQKQKSRMSRSCSSMEDFGDLNQSFQQKGHESRIATWKKEHVDNRPEEFQFVKPSTTVKHGAWRRSRSQDSDGFLKRQKNHSNMELAKSYNNSSRDLSENPWVLQSSVENILPASVPIDDNRVFEEIAKFTQSRLVEGEINPQYTYKNSGGSVEKIDSEKADHAKPGDRSFSNKIKKETENQENQYFGGAYYDNYGFDENAGSDHTDSADITVVNTESANITMTNDNSGGFDVTFYEPEYEEGAFESPNRSFEEEISPEDERQLEANASLIVSEIQNNKMTGSSVDEDMFIENETLSLVSGGYTSDTASEVSLTWSAKSEQLSEFSETTTVSNDDSTISTGAKIVKPSNTRQVNQEVQNQKAIRGRRKPLYSPRSAPNMQKAPVAKIDTNLKKPVNTTNRSNSTSKLTQGNVNKKTSSTRTTSHPQACSTPTRSPPKPKMTTKTSPPQQQNKSTTNRSPNSKTSPPSRLPTSTAGRKGGNSVEKPKPPIKQRTFIKDSPSANVPVIDVNDSFEFDENGNDTSNNLDNSKTLTGNQTKKSTDTNRHSNEINTESWSKALESYNFVPENSAENSKKEQNFGQKNLKSGSTGVKSSTKGGQNMANNHVSSTGNMSNKGKAGVNTPGKQQNKINKSNNLSNLKKTYSGTSLTKSGSGASLNKSGSGASLNKSGSGASLNKTGSGTIFNKSGVNGLNKAGSNPNLKKVNSKGDLKKSNSNASLKSSSRPSTPVGRKNSNPIQVSKKSDNQPNKTSPQSSNTASKVTPSDSKKSLTGNACKKQVNSKIAGLWRKEDNESPAKNNVSKLPVSTNNSPRGQQNKGGKSQQQKGNINSSFQKNSSFTIMRTESPHDGISRSSTYDKLDSTNDSSRLPCLDDIEKDAEKDMQVPVEKTSIAGASSIEKKVTSFDSDLNKSVMEEKMSLTSPEEFDLKSLEKRIDTSTWKKKKPKNEMLCLPNADETAKSLEAVRAVLNASILNESSMINSSVNDSLFTESFTDRSVSGTSWRHYREDSYSSCAPSDDEESIWIRRDADTSRSEPQLSKFSVKEKKQKRKSKGEGHSFLPIKAVKQMFRRKSTSNTSLTSSRDSNLDKSDAEDEKSTLKRKIFSKKKSDKDKKALEKASRNGSVSSLESSKTSPQSALVPPFNYTPSNTSISKPQSPSTEISESRDQDSVFVKPLPVKPLTTVHATKTEMLLARRRQSYLNSLKSDETSEEDKKRQGCMVTTV